MRILYFHQHFTTPALGGGTRSYEFARHLIGKGHEVCVVCGESVDLKLPPGSQRGIHRGFIDGIEVVQIKLKYANRDSVPKRAWTFVKFAFHGIRLALTEKYDLLFATSTPLTVSLPGITMKMFRRKKFVFEVRDLWPELPRALGLKNPFLLWGMSAMEWCAYRAANGCIGLAPGICNGIKRRAPEGRKIAFVPNGCDLQLFRQMDFRMQLDGITEKDTVAVFTGAHGIGNGLNAVLDAAAELLKRGRTDIKILFVGDGKLKSSLMERARSESLTNCIFYAPVSKEKLNQIISRADVGLMILANIPAFYYGTSPNKFFDYISAGLPVLNNYPGWLADMINEYKCGIAVPPSDPKAFAEGLIFLADHPELRKVYGQNARALAESRFSRNKLAEEFVTFIEEVSR